MNKFSSSRFKHVRLVTPGLSINAREILSAAKNLLRVSLSLFVIGQRHIIADAQFVKQEARLGGIGF